MKYLPMRHLNQGLIILGLLLSVPAVAVLTLPPLTNTPGATLLPGKFIWFDLATPDLQNQKAFYGDLFGWTFSSPGGSDDQYTLVLNQGQAIAGMFSFEPPDGEKDAANWISLMSVPDADAAVKTARASGGKVDVAAASVPRRGRHALLRDPGGALFGVLRSDSGDPPDGEVPIGGVLWVDLFALDVDEMTRFYSSLAPFEMRTMDIKENVSRVILSTQGEPRAGIVMVADDANRSAWVPYVRVSDVPAVLEKVVAAGGFAIVPTNPELLDGNLAIFVDPNGAVMGIVKWDYSEGGGP